MDTFYTNLDFLNVDQIIKHEKFTYKLKLIYNNKLNSDIYQYIQNTE